MEAYCQLAVASANTMFANSAVAARARLVHTARVDYAESGEVALDLARLTILPTASWMSLLRCASSTAQTWCIFSARAALRWPVWRLVPQANATPF